MFGSFSQWFYQWLGGIQPAPDAFGFDRILIRPQMPKMLSWVNSSYNSVRGLIVSNWWREDRKLTLDITIPANATATVHVPAKNAAGVTESGVSAAKAEGAQILRTEGTAEVFKVSSGQYHFRADQLRSRHYNELNHSLQPELKFPTSALCQIHHRG
jgi:alpha-L-rhamnosidase